MASFEILCTTMHQNDFSKIQEMNIRSDVVFANQCDHTSYEELNFDGHIAKMISTATKGVSKNRNIAITFASSDYVMFADDDLRFYDNYVQLVEDVLKEHPEADAIQFSTNISSISNAKNVKELGKQQSSTYRKATRRTSGRNGVCAFLIKSSVLKKKNLWFDENFGSGTEDYCGEDTIFLQKLFKKNVAYFVSPIVIADIDKSQTTWFEGHTQKYFTVGGKILAACYPRIAYFLAIRSAYRFHKRKVDKGFLEILSFYWRGIREYKKQKK